MAQKNKRIIVIDIQLFSPLIHNCHTVKAERKSEGWEKLLNSWESGLNKMAEGKKPQIPAFLVLYIATGKEMATSNDITCKTEPRSVNRSVNQSVDWSVTFSQRKLRRDGWSIGQAVSKIFIFDIYSILGVVRRGVRGGSPWTGP